MNKDSIYKLIGYNGEYNDNVKKAIRKLLKENHPDNKGDRRIFELINEVKEELENNKVTYKSDTHHDLKDNDFVDYSFCREMIDKITKEKKIYVKKLEKLKEKQEKFNLEYKKNYRKSVDLETYLLANTQYANELKKTKYYSIIVLILTIIVFTISIWKRSLVLFIIFTILVIICVLTIRKSFDIMHKITENSRIKLNSYVGVNGRLRDNVAQQEQLKKEMLDVGKIINNLENDLRFYNNILNNR